MKKQTWKIEKINIVTILCLLIMACPILDVVSFLFRNQFQTNFSPSTVLRPVIPIVVIFYLFFKKESKFKLFTFCAFLLYGIYAVVHLWVFEQLKTGSSYSNFLHEAQYLVNYSFMILNLFLYLFVFKEEKTTALRKSIFYCICIYIILFILAFVTGTSSYTYVQEQIGRKGWFESGNSLSAILVLSLFILLPLLQEKKYQKIVVPLLIIIGIILTTVIGTRVGLLGYFLVCFLYFIIESGYYLIRNKKISEKSIIIGLSCFCIVSIMIGTVGSSTLRRRNQLKEQEDKLIDPMTNQVAHLTGDLVEIKQQIDKGTLPENYMTEPEKKSIVELYNIAERWNLSHTQMRTIQVIYHCLLMKNQSSFLSFLLGNGYVSHFRELVLEMEIPAFLFNFGLLRILFVFYAFLYVVPIWILPRLEA